MGRIVIQYERHKATFWQKYWGLILFPLFPIWALTADDGEAGWLDIDGRSFRLKYRKKSHPQVIDIPDGVHSIVYRKKSKLALAFNAWTRQDSPVLDSILDRMGAFDDYKLTGIQMDFGPNTVLTLSARGGYYMRECQIVDVKGVPQREVAPAGAPPSGDDSGSGCGKWLIALLIVALLLGGLATLMYLTLMEKTVKPAPDIDRHEMFTTTTTESATTTTAPEGDIMYVVADGGLRMRSEPNTDGKVILTVPTKSQIVVLRTEGDWSYVRYNGKEGWCASAWIFPSIEEATTTTTTKATTTTAPTGTDSVRIVTEGINEANRHIESYRGKTVSNAHTKETLTEDEVMDLFRNAYNLYMDYAWGNITGGFDSTGGTVYENVPILGSMDGVWRPGTHPEFPDFDTLVRSYYAYFADDLAADYLRDKIALINAKMYYTTYPGTGDEGVKSTVDYAVETVADGYNVKVTANYYRDYDNPDRITETKYFEFPLRREDGAWVFTKMQWIPN